ncbi:YoaK family protein [Clostridium thermarum]|uniref:YoaK family protein n=1 Tax=Clostridium thermarum TaxID=1716543 RepID=UPI001FAE6076|nr:YoaK family protein [Clostridium thermarum]
MKTKNVQMSESYLVGMLFAVVGGFLDAYTYILRGHVFANAQTRNMVLLAIKLAEGDFKVAGIYLIPIAAFITGILIAEYTRKKLTHISKLH